MGRLRRRRSFIWLWGAICFYGWNMLNRPGIHWGHAGPRGGILTTRSVNWRNINGIIIRTRNTQTFLHFRRFPWYLVRIKKR